MCQIQLIHRFDNKELTKEDLSQFKNLMWLGSFSNDDAWGVYDTTSKKLTKNGDKLEQDDLKFLSNTKGSTLFGHNRFKTKGDPKFNYNNHPFETENFVVVHNGVLSCDDALKKNCNLVYEVQTDSYVIPALLEKVYKDTQDIKDTLVKVASILAGSFSLVIFFKPENRLFYFKERGTSFHFALAKTSTGDVLLGSTQIDNFNKVYTKIERDYFNIRSIPMNVVKPNAEEILEITSKGMEVLEQFSESNYTLANNSTWSSEEKKFIAFKREQTRYEKQISKNKDLDYEEQWDGYMKQDTLHGESPIEETLLTEKELRDGVESWYNEVLNYLEETLDKRVASSSFILQKRKLFFVLGDKLSNEDKKWFADMYGWIGDLTIKTRTNSKVDEIVIEPIHEYACNREMAQGYTGKAI